MQIINFLYELARQHKRINSFVYGKAYTKGAGNNKYPLFWLDDPVSGRTNGDNAIVWSLNIDVIGIPANELEVEAVQTAAFNSMLTTFEKIKDLRKHGLSVFSMGDFNFISLRNYYDDNAAGFRFSFTVTQANPVNRCADDFDPDKQFVTTEALPVFETDAPNGCAVFNDKGGLPNFKLS